MKRITIAFIGAVVLAIGVVGGSRKAEAKTNSTEYHLYAYVPRASKPYYSYQIHTSYKRVEVKSYKVKDGLLYVTEQYGDVYIGNNIVIHKEKVY
jgi:hypothetical protein